MTLSLLFDGAFEAYAEAARRDAGLWLFVHVPKTAGSSLGSELAQLAPPYHNIHIDHLDRDRPGPERFDAAVARFLDAARGAAPPFRSASGHLQYRHMEAIRTALPGVRPVTMLRHPMRRLVSDYRYQRSPMHPLHAEVAERAPDFRTFLDMRGPQNRMAKALVPMPMIRRGKVREAVAHVMDRFTFVGLQEHYALSFRLLTTLVGGTPVAPTERRRVNEDGAPVVITPELEALARERNAMDWAIHDAVAERFTAIAERASAWLDARTQAAGDAEAA